MTSGWLLAWRELKIRLSSAVVSAWRWTPTFDPGNVRRAASRVRQLGTLAAAWLPAGLVGRAQHYVTRHWLACGGTPCSIVARLSPERLRYGSFLRSRK